MEIKYSDIEDAFMFVSSGQLYDCSACISLKTGKTHYQSDYVDFDELPEDIDDSEYITIPHQTELGLGRDLVLDFAYEYLGNHADEVEGIFRRKGAYSRFKGLLDRLGKLELWYSYENNARQEAILEWCEENNVSVSNIPEYEQIDCNPQGQLDETIKQQYLENTEIINWQHPEIIACSKKILKGCSSENEYVLKAFEYVRDTIKHSWDYQKNPVTCIASDVLEHKTGFCYAKSHLLAALLRVQKIPVGFCYQRLSAGDSGAPYCLHGLNAVYLQEAGWYRIDARGNKKGVNAQFSPPEECLAFTPVDALEKDLPEIWDAPLPIIAERLQKYTDIKQLYENLPDIQVVT